MTNHNNRSIISLNAKEQSYFTIVQSKTKKGVMDKVFRKTIVTKPIVSITKVPEKGKYKMSFEIQPEGSE
jgi:hypothetical protein